MQYAHEIMDRDYLSVSPATPVGDLARMLLDRHADGAVVIEDDRLVGVVTAMDLVFQEKRVHLPSFITLMDLVIPLGGSRAKAELEKITGGSVREIMSTSPVTVAWDAPLDEVATLMVERHFTILPVMKGDHLQGVISKPDLLRAAYNVRNLA